MHRTVLAATGLLAAAMACAADEDVTELAPITIGRSQLTPDQLTAPTADLDRAMLEQRQAVDLGDVLRGIAGLAIEGGPRQAALQPNIRGLGEGRVVMRIDGARQNMNITHRGQSFIDPALLQRVEVWRGPASTLYGSGAIGGVVNFHTLDAQAFLDAGRSLGGGLSGGYQDNGNQRFGAATLAATHAGFGAIGSLSRRRSSDFQDGDGNDVALTGSDVLSGLLKGTWQGEADQRVTLSYLGFDDDAASLATADRPTGTVVNRNTRQHTGSLRYEWRPATSDFWDLDLTGYHTDLRLDERGQASGNRQLNELATTGLDAYNTSLLSAGRIEHHVTWGLELYRDRQRGTENGAPRLGFASSRQRTLGVFAQDRIELAAPLQLTLGLRYDRISQSAERIDGENNRLAEVSSHLALAWQFAADTSLYASYAEAFRAPALRELYVGGQHFPGNLYLPNPELQPEKARNKELGLVHAQRGVLLAGDVLRLRLSVFQNDVEDFIEQVVAAATTRFENVDTARIRGVELEGRYQTARTNWQAAAALQRGDDRGTGLPLESIPADSLYLQGALRWADGAFETGARASVARAQRRVPAGPFTIDDTSGYQLFDLFARWTPKPGLQLQASLDNVTDQRYRQHLNQLNGRGRTLKLQLQQGF